jgi:hypothetical protein
MLANFWKMLATLQKNVDEKMLEHFRKMLRKKIDNISEKYWWKKYYKQFKKLLIKKSQSAWVFWDFNLLGGLFWASWALWFACLSTFRR